MLMLVPPFLALLIALLRGGSLTNLLNISIRWSFLVLLGLGLQLLIFTPLRARLGLEGLIPPLYILSMLILVAWVVLNRHIPGIVWMAGGLVLNLLAIAANGGYMPVDPQLVQVTGQVREIQDGSGAYNNSLITGAPVQLWILTAILPVPAYIPFANVFSIGDVLLTLGASIFLYRTIHPKATPGAPQTATPESQASQAALPK